MADAPTTDILRQQIGELVLMQASTEAMERKIMARAQHLLSDVETKITDTRKLAMTDERAAADYQAAIVERGRLHQIIAQSRAHLS